MSKVFGLFEITNPNGGNWRTTKSGATIQTSGKAQKMDESKYRDSLGGHSSNYRDKNHK